MKRIIMESNKTHKYYYYQIKGKTGDKDGWSNWTFPPIYSGRIKAENKIEAKKMIEQNYNKHFPLRVLNKDLDSNEFLLKIEDMTNNNYLIKLFEYNECKNEECKKKFRRIDLYNDTNVKTKGMDYCSDKCREIEREKYEIERIKNFNNPEMDNPNGFYNIPVIYKITNKNNNMCYIGQTTQSFTLRWWQHIKWGESDCKFHKAIQKGKLTDWLFEIIEVVENRYCLDERESYYIKQFDSINKGYNTVKVNGKEK